MITGAEFYQMSEAHEGVLNYSDTEHLCTSRLRIMKEIIFYDRYSFS